MILGGQMMTWATPKEDGQIDSYEHSENLNRFVFFWAWLPKIETLDSNLKYLSLVLTIKNGPKMSRSTSSRLF